MTDQEMTWEEWVEELAIASGGQVDYWLVDEESAETNHPELYEYYQMGYDPNELVSERLLSYEGGSVMLWLDPDDPEIELTFPAPVPITALAEAFGELRIQVQDEYGSELTLNNYKFQDDGSMTLKISYPPEIPGGKRFIEESLKQRTNELELQIRYLEGKLESKDLELERFERLLSVPKLQIDSLQVGNNNSMSVDRTINTGGGNYYESINTNGGHYIQGNYVNMSQDLTQAASQIQDLIEQLQQDGAVVEVAKEQVARDIAKQAQNNSTVKAKLIKWGQSLGDATVSDVVKGAVKLAIRSAGLPLP
jgi:hypothetical protein